MVLYFLYLGYLLVRWYVIIKPFWYLVSSHVSYIIIVLLLQAWANWLLPNKTNHLQTNEPQHIPGQQQVNMCRVFYCLCICFPVGYSDDGSKQRYINNENWSNRKTWIPENIFFFQKRQNNCEELNTRFHAKFLSVILKNPYYTPCTAHIITPPCNTDQVITPLGYMTCCISNLSHRQN
jgi:hypothetical protein